MFKWTSDEEALVYIVSREQRQHVMFTWTSSKNLLPFLTKESRLMFKKYQISCDSGQILPCLVFQTRFFLSWTSAKSPFSFLLKESCLESKNEKNLVWSPKTNKNLARTEPRTSTSVEWSAYRMHDSDPIFFSNGFRFEWRNGDVVDERGFKCLLYEGGSAVGSPASSIVIADTSVYVW